MAVRCVYKLLSKTCFSSSHSAYTTVSSVSSDRCYRGQNRSYSQLPQNDYLLVKNKFQLRSISKSLESFKDNKHSQKEEEGETINHRNAFPMADLSIRDPAKEFKEKIQAEEETEDGNPIYELTECSRSQENFYEVLKVMKREEEAKMKFVFPHLQPYNLKPYGSTENFHMPLVNRRKKLKIVYPSTRAARETELSKKKKENEVTLKECPSCEESKRMAIRESKSVTNKKNYSTTSLNKKLSTHKLSLKFNSSTARKSSNILLKKSENINNHQSTRVRRISSKELALKRVNSSRSYNTQNDICSDYVTVKLSDLKEECRKAKKCKPPKISFGRLPKLPASDCPCLEDQPLKEGKPLARMKQRFEVKEPPRVCIEPTTCLTPRADANYVIKPKTLSKLQLQDCPCEEREMTDLVIRRLPKKKIAEPPKISCEEEVSCPARADGQILVERKQLPALEINDCPCIEETPLKDIPLKKLKKIHIEEPAKVCLEQEKCDVALRSDYGLKVERKILPEIKGECPCPIPQQIVDAKPLSRLPKIIYEDVPKICPEERCDVSIRADKDLAVAKKVLPKFVPQNCPCIEPEIPEKVVEIKRLVPRPVEEKPRVCPKELECDPRADDGMVIKRKQLPVIETQDCPCVIEEMKECEPLKRLVPKPVEEKPKVCRVTEECTTPRSDENLKVEMKTLPVLSGGSCPCVEPPQPLDVKPLAKLKKRPVTYKQVCAKKICAVAKRADENYQVKAKKLPKLQINDCPCIEAEAPVDVPLARLKKVRIPEPPKICKTEETCDDIPRADRDDWLYWRHVEVKPPECESKPENISTRSYSTYRTISRRCYSTNLGRVDNLKLNYDIPRSLRNTIHNIIIDIKPSIPLILTQKPLQFKTTEISKFSKSEPVECVTFVVCKSSSLGFSDSSFSSRNRYISTCSTLCEYSERAKDKLKDHVTPSCECPPDDRYLQPRNPIIPEKEQFITPYPDDDFLSDVARKSRKYCRTRKETEDNFHFVKETAEERDKEEKKICSEEDELIEVCKREAEVEEEKLSLWERIVNYFKARPNCPSPEEFKKIKLREKAERAALKAGLCLYDPKELLMKNQKDLPKVITAEPPKEQECGK